MKKIFNSMFILVLTGIYFDICYAYSLVNTDVLSKLEFCLEIILLLGYDYFIFSHISKKIFIKDSYQKIFNHTCDILRLILVSIAILFFGIEIVFSFEFTSVIIFIIISCTFDLFPSSIYEKDVRKKEFLKYDLNREELKKELYDEFIEIENAYTDFNYDKLKELSTDYIYSSYKKELDNLKHNHKKKVRKDFELKEIRIYNLTEIDDKIIIDLYIKVRYYDYILNIKDEEIISGSDYIKACDKYNLSFIKNKGDFILSRIELLNEKKVKTEMENEGVILNKVDHIFIQLFTSIMLDKLDEVDHYISDEVYNYYNNILNDLRKKNYRQMYDGLNVKDSYVISIEKTNDNYVINVKLIARYMDYVIDLNSGEVVSGDNKKRCEVTYDLEFIRKINVKEQDRVRTCPNCGRPLDVSKSGKCSYCGSIYNQEDYDIVLHKISKI